MPTPKTPVIRFSTLSRKYGPVVRADKMPDAEWQKAVAEGRFATVYHAENNWCEPVVAVIRRHGCVNTLCKLAFAKPVPPDVGTVVGMRNNDEAWSLCNPE